VARKTNILAIDDDKFALKIIKRTFSDDQFDCRTAENGELGLAEALREKPDVILLDVEMPGLNGYEVCDRLRSNESTSDVPVIFLSGRSSLQERLQGYDAGGDDYLVKPFDRENLLAKIKVLSRYRYQRDELKEQYDLARKTAKVAITNTSDLGVAMGFMEKTYGYNTFEKLSEGLFEVTDRLGIECTVMISIADDVQWFSSDGVLKPIEMELLGHAEKDKRFFDFGAHTIVNFSQISLLVRNMPLDNMERYGQIKDVLPVILTAANTRTNVIQVELALMQQSKDLLTSLGRIRTQFYHLVKNLIDSQEKSSTVMTNMSSDLNMDLMTMGLEVEQETLLLERINSAVGEAMVEVDSTTAIHGTMSSVLDDLKATVKQQEELVEAFAASQQPASENQLQNYESDIELF